MATKLSNFILFMLFFTERQNLKFTQFCSISLIFLCICNVLTTCQQHLNIVLMMSWWCLQFSNSTASARIKTAFNCGTSSWSSSSELFGVEVCCIHDLFLLSAQAMTMTHFSLLQTVNQWISAQILSHNTSVHQTTELSETSLDDDFGINSMKLPAGVTSVLTVAKMIVHGPKLVSIDEENQAKQKEIKLEGLLWPTWFQPCCVGRFLDRSLSDNWQKSWGVGFQSQSWSLPLDSSFFSAMPNGIQATDSMFSCFKESTHSTRLVLVSCKRRQHPLCLNAPSFGRCHAPAPFWQGLDLSSFSSFLSWQASTATRRVPSFSGSQATARREVYLSPSTNWVGLNWGQMPFCLSLLFLQLPLCSVPCVLGVTVLVPTVILMTQCCSTVTLTVTHLKNSSAELSVPHFRLKNSFFFVRSINKIVPNHLAIISLHLLIHLRVIFESS